MQNNLSQFHHVIINNNAEKTVFLLHGTGGTEHDFLFLDEALGKSFNLVGIRGNIDEHGMTRFFKRLSEGVFDQESIREEAKNLHNFITAWIQEYKTRIENLTFLGYSNGANILLAALFYYPEIMRKLALLHPMLPFDPRNKKLTLTQHTLFVSYGIRDSMVPESQSRTVIEILQSSGAEVTVGTYPSGHEIGREEIQDTVTFLQTS